MDNNINAIHKLNFEVHDDGSKELEAGLRPLDHYRQRLGYKFPIRQSILPLVRAETPYLASLQAFVRSPILDIFFVNTANLGTHTFFLIALPIFFWLGDPEFARGLVDLLAPGVFFTGMVKDFLCLPRPLSPPLQRITMSGLTALEYGFPSTHSANAVSVALYGLTLLEKSKDSMSGIVRFILQVVIWVYMISVVLGRIYCGMHGFLDCLAGVAIGSLLWWLKIIHGEYFDSFIASGSWWPPIVVLFATVFLIRVHPEPADACCKCFEDGVAFAGVFVGVKFGQWRDPIALRPHQNTSFTPTPLNIIRIIIVIISGVSVLFAWRATMKPMLHRILPPFYRLLEKARLDMPRRYFMRASAYQTVPPIPDQPIPSLKEIPELLARFGRPRSVSVGPQSEIDVWEQLDYRDERRRRRSNSVEHNFATQENGKHLNSVAEQTFSDDTWFGDDDDDDDKILSVHIEEPRVRYDVEVVTKLIVYAGIGWLSVDFLPIAFQALGLTG